MEFDKLLMGYSMQSASMLQNKNTINVSSPFFVQWMWPLKKWISTNHNKSLHTIVWFIIIIFLLLLSIVIGTFTNKILYWVNHKVEEFFFRIDFIVISFIWISLKLYSIIKKNANRTSQHSIWFPISHRSCAGELKTLRFRTQKDLKEKKIFIVPIFMSAANDLDHLNDFGALIAANSFVWYDEHQTESKDQNETCLCVIHLCAQVVSTHLLLLFFFCCAIVPVMLKSQLQW